MKKLLKPVVVPKNGDLSVASAASAANTLQSFIGKTFKLSKSSVVVEEVIAEGGFGVVFLARADKKIVALKRVVVNSEEGKRATLREIDIMTTLGDHPNILPCLDSATTALSPDITELIFTMPFIKQNLHQILQRSFQAKVPLEEGELLLMLSDVLQGLSRLHFCTTPILHRDLKVENILYDGEHYLICDFGSATTKIWDPSVHSAALISEDLERYTTLAYRAPEMVDLYSSRGSLGTKCDIWALGILLYKATYWTLPFGESILQIQSGRCELSTPATDYTRLLSYLLIVDQTDRPDVWQVSELLHGLMGVTNPMANLGNSKLPMTFGEIEDYKLNEGKGGQAEVKVGGKDVVVLETSVVPRSRPVPGNKTAALAPIDIIPPPISPKVERKRQEIPENSWNPFESPPSPTATPPISAVPSDDPFANAPFDDFAYIPMSEGLGIPLQFSSNNPFLEGQF